MHPIDRRLQTLGIMLPPRSRPAGNYLPACRCDRLLFVSGQFPLENGRLKYCGQIGRDLTPEDGYQAAQLAALNALAHLRHENQRLATAGQHCAHRRPHRLRREFP